MIGNQRGIALVLTLLVVALLTITVIEFTYSVEIDQHMARNALNGLQASLLARSGVNLGEAVLLHDDDPLVDAYTEDWGRIDDLNSQLIVPDNMRLKVQIVDEGGKLNINLTRPPNVTQWRNAKAAAANAPPQYFQSWQTVLGHLLSARGVDPTVADAVENYWDQLYQASYPDQAAAAGTPGAAATTPTPVNPQTNASANLVIAEFPSLDDVSVIPGFTPAVIRAIRSVVTALPSRQARVNANTAPREVLSAIISDGDVVEAIMTQRQNDGLKQADLQQLVSKLGSSQDVADRNARNMLGVQSSYFLIRTSAIVNPDPLTGRGGISRSASMLVQRGPKPGVPPNAPAGTPRWTLTQLDWQKEGGAALFVQKTDQDPSAVDDVTTEVPRTGG